MKKILLSMFLLGTLLNANAQVPSYVPKDSLKGWWPFSGNANDLSGNGNNGIVNGAVLTTDRFGLSNKAYIYDGLNDFISVPHKTILNLPGTGSFSFSAWVFKTSYKKEMSILSKGPGNGANSNDVYIFSLNPNPKIGLQLANYPNAYWTTSSDSIRNNSWSHVVVVYESTSKSSLYYINGVYVGKQAYSFSPSSNGDTNPLFFGKQGYNCDCNYFDGKIDDIGVWNRALTQNEITKLYIGCNKTITQEPVNQGMFTGNATFTCATNDTLVNYQWQSDLGMGWNNLSNAGQYSGTTSNSLQVSNVTSNNNNQKFRCITKGNCLTDTTNEVTLRVWGLGVQSEQIKAFKVYPNPTKGQVTIENGDIAKMIGYTVSIYNSIGQQLFQSNITQQQSLLDISQLGGNGLYFMEVTDNNGNILDVKKIVLQ
jgi:hypothetical protein